MLYYSIQVYYKIFVLWIKGFLKIDRHTLIFLWHDLYKSYLFLAATKQLYDWFSPSVRPSVRPSVCLSVTPFSPCSYHRIIMKFSGVITMVRSDVHAKGQGQRSKVKVTEVNTQLSRFRTLIPVWIHIWQWNHAHSWKQHRRGALLFSRSSVKFQGHTALKIVEFDPDWAFPDCNSSLNSPMATKWCTKLEVALKRCPIVFQGHLSNFKVTRL